MIKQMIEKKALKEWLIKYCHQIGGVLEREEFIRELFAVQAISLIDLEALLDNLRVEENPPDNSFHLEVMNYNMRLSFNRALDDIKKILLQKGGQVMAMDDLFFAVYYEHKGRTGHDVFRNTSLYINCDVCLYLDKIKKEHEKEEREYFEREKAQAINNVKNKEG